MTSDFKYFNSVILVMVSNPVEALSFPQSPRSPYEPLRLVSSYILIAD